MSHTHFHEEHTARLKRFSTSAKLIVTRVEAFPVFFVRPAGIRYPGNRDSSSSSGKHDACNAGCIDPSVPAHQMRHSPQSQRSSHVSATDHRWCWAEDLRTIGL